MIDAILFDLYQTLTIRVTDPESEPDPGAVVVSVLEQLGADVSDLNAETVEDEIWEFSVTSSNEERTPFENRLGAFSRSRLGHELTSVELRTLADAVCARWEQHHQTAPDAHDVLGTLGKSRQLGLVSNFDHPPHVRRRLAETRLLGHFVAVVVSGEVGVQKPDPEILRIACDLIEVAPEKCAYVGDSIVDYQAAAGIGMRFFWMSRPSADQFDRFPSDDPFLQTDAQLQTLSVEGAITRVQSLTELREAIEGATPVV